MKFGEFTLHIIRECTFKLDGGAMFGVVPKTLWGKTSQCDEQNRVPLACNLLFIETPNANVLIETGMGPRWTERERQRYEVKPLLDYDNFLASIGKCNNDVDAVVISHLHFDHAGGAVAFRENKLVPAFPRARYYVQRGEWEFAHNANARAKGSYRHEDFAPLMEYGVLELIDGDTQIVPGVQVRVTGGHTSHHQVVVFESGDRKGVYFADIIPTKNHLSPPWVMGYDHYPLTSCDIKSEYLATAAEENWLVVFDHEVEVPWGHVKMTGDNKFEWQPLPVQTLAHRQVLDSAVP
ncbi:MAG: MBL fold metallo-hydrolase [Candidatus Obscuribacterales bacterium]|nr:MBL fold metallo-hydrolase [Candidatus Obscuribacterales bacterium]